MAYVDDLIESRNNMAARLKEITASPKPSYIIDGQNIQWSAYHNMLLSGMKTTEDAIKRADDGGAFEELTQVYTSDRINMDR